jgi:hypothetical protein
MRESLDEIAASLNVNGNQNIARLQMTIGSKESPEQSNGESRSGQLVVPSQTRDSRMPLQDGRAMAGTPPDEDEAPLDMDLFPSEELNLGRGRHATKRLHIFGQAEVSRGEDDEDSEDNDFDGQERSRRRAAGLSIVHKLVTSQFPHTLLSCIPRSLSYPTQSILFFSFSE